MPTPVTKLAVFAVCLLLPAASGIYALPQVAAYPQVSSSYVVADNTTPYTVTASVSDADGYSDIIDIRVLFNYSEADNDSAKGRGYLAWATTNNYITRYGGTWVLAASGGFGRWGYCTDLWSGTDYLTPVSCSAVASGAASGGTGTITVTWTFRAKPAWTMNPLTNDADFWFADAANNRRGWLDSPNSFDVVAAPCSQTCATPSAPVVSQPDGNGFRVSIADADPDNQLYAIRISPALLPNDYVQADGTVTGWPVYRTKAQWGTTNITGLASDTSFSVLARAARLDAGWCPSEWSAGSPIATSVVTRAIDPSVPGRSISKGVMGNVPMSWVHSAQMESDMVAVCVNTMVRWGFDGYNWKLLNWSFGSGSTDVTTLTRLRQARDMNSDVINCVNTRGIGTGNGSTFAYTDQTPATLAALAADWVYYCNHILQNRRQGDTLTPREQAIIDSLQWGTQDKLLAPGEAPVPTVTYWEIGNEPEGPYPAPALTASDYANRYKTIAQAILAEDPAVKVGPSVMSADNGNAWLDAVYSDSANRVDFSCYHPYGPLFFNTKQLSGGVLNAEDLNAGLNDIRPVQAQRRQKMVDCLVANGRPSVTPLMATESNPSGWEANYYYNLNRIQAHALGVVEMIFTHADLGLLAAHYWDRPNYPSNTAIEAPGFKVLKTLQRFLGNRLVDVYTETDFRLYTTVDDATGRVCIWALNLADSRDKTIGLQVQNTAQGSIFQHRLALASGSTSLISANQKNDPYEKIIWTVTDLTDTAHPADLTVTFPRATVTLLRFDPPVHCLPDGCYITLSNRSVTSVYPDEAYLYIENDNRASGIRVVGNCAGIAVGDRVEVTGMMGTIRPDGETESERCIGLETIRKAATDTPIKPLAMSCRDLGGGPRPGTVGVREGFGPSSIGLLVRIAGKVTEIVDIDCFYLDDGSSPPDVNGNTGVLVRCVSTQNLVEGQVVTVTGGVEGSVPLCWDENRRYLRTRFATDIAPVAP